MQRLAVLFTVFFSLSLSAESHRAIIGTDLAEKVGAKIIQSDKQLGVSIIEYNSLMEPKLHRHAHELGRCGGFTQADDIGVLDNLRKQLHSSKVRLYNEDLTFNPLIESAVEEVDTGFLQEWVTWFSSFRNRDSGRSNRNAHVAQMVTRLQTMVSPSSLPITIERVSHTSTQQDSLRVRIEGSEFPNEIVVLGGHYDSISYNWFGPIPIPTSDAPGADDNASGSSNLVQILNILMMQEQPKRSIEFFWYGGEEKGLLGSGDIAKEYKQQGKDVIAVMQLDMTLNPGNGVGTIASMTDFTSGWLRDMIFQLNALYVRANVIESECGYGCSDHASWYNQEFPTVFPTEATFDNMNKSIHTPQDIIGTRSSFDHSALFSQLGVAFAMELANSTRRQPQ